MSAVATLLPSETTAVVDADGAQPVDTFLAAVHAALALGRPLKAYNFVVAATAELLQKGHHQVLADVGIAGLDDLVEVTLSEAFLAQDKLKAMGLDCAGRAAMWLERQVAAAEDVDAAVLVLASEYLTVEDMVAELGTRLSGAAAAGQLDRARFLLASAERCGADVKARVCEWSQGAAHRCGRCPLHEAARRGDLEAVKLLVEHGASVAATGGGGRTALHLAAYHGHEAVVEYLVAHGASHEAQGRDGSTPLHLASYFGHEGAKEALLRAGASQHIVNKKGDTPVAMAARGRMRA